MTAPFEPGEIVDVTIKGVRMGEMSHIRVTIEDERGELWVLPPQAAITRVAPAQWPPQAGDLWKDRDGDLWFAVLVDSDCDADEPYVELQPGRSSKHPGPSWISDGTSLLQHHGPFTLVHREDEQDGSES